MVLRGVERHKAPTLADDGGAIECINLRPTTNGLQLVHDKPNRFSSSFGADSIDDVISAVYRHRALPENHFVVVLNNRKMAVFLEKDGRLSPMTDGQDNIIYFASYDKDIVSIGELNNVLVVRTAGRQDLGIGKLLPDGQKKGGKHALPAFGYLFSELDQRRNKPLASASSKQAMMPFLLMFLIPLAETRNVIQASSSGT